MERRSNPRNLLVQISAKFSLSVGTFPYTSNCTHTISCVVESEVWSSSEILPDVSKASSECCQLPSRCQPNQPPVAMMSASDTDGKKQRESSKFPPSHPFKYESYLWYLYSVGCFLTSLCFRNKVSTKRTCQTLSINQEYSPQHRSSHPYSGYHHHYFLNSRNNHYCFYDWRQVCEFIGNNC